MGRDTLFVFPSHAFPCRYRKSNRFIHGLKNIAVFLEFILTKFLQNGMITKLTISSEGRRGCSTMARAPAFQAGDAGSIPVTRSNFFSYAPVAQLDRATAF